MEIWKPIPGYEKTHEASSFGRIRSLDRIIIQKTSTSDTIVSRNWKGRIKKPYLDNGRLSTIMGNQTKSVHRLIADTFLGPLPNGLVCAHINGDFTDNRPSNLIYCTQKENNNHKIIHGTMRVGANHHASKFTESDVLWMRKNYKRGKKGKNFNCMAFAKKFKVAPSSVRRAIVGRSWAHVK